MKLHHVVDHVSSFRAPLPGIARLSSLASERCEGVGSDQYVAPNGKERWEGVSSEVLIQDVKEELADAFAYLAALAWRTHDAEWIGTFPLIGLLFAQIEQLEQKDVSLEERTS